MSGSIIQPETLEMNYPVITVEKNSKEKKKMT